MPGRPDPVHITYARDGSPVAGAGQFDLSAGGWLPPTTGLVYGVILNDQRSLDLYGERMHKAPHGKPPSAPVLYIKPYNTHVGHRSVVTLPAGADRVEIGACLGIVFGGPCTRVTTESATSLIAGYTIAIDLSLPKDNLYRPPILEKCFDGACPLGPWCVDRDDVGDPSTLTIRTWVNDELVATRSAGDVVRPAAELIAEICHFMTFLSGDVLLMGYPLDVPTARPGDRIAVEIDGLGRLECALAAPVVPR